MAEQKKVAIIHGIGASDGLGGGLARRFSAEGYHVVLAGRTQAKLDSLLAEIIAAGGSGNAVVADVTDVDQIRSAYDVAEAAGDLDAVLYNAGNNAMIPFMDLDAAMFEDFWRVGCLGGFVVGQEAIRRLAPKGRGSILFTGASGSLRGKSNFSHFASAKAGLRMLVQSMAREYGPKGLHIGHVIVDGIINGERIKQRMSEYLEGLGEDGSLAPDDIASAFWMMHIQHRSAWTQELDLRPYKENW